MSDTPCFAIAIDTEFEGPWTLTVQAATWLDPETLVVQIYRHPDVPLPPDEFDIATVIPLTTDRYGKFGITRVVWRPVKLITADLSPGRMFRDLFEDRVEEWPPLFPYSQGLARPRPPQPGKIRRPEELWGGPQHSEQVPGIDIELIGQFLRADLGRLGRNWYASLDPGIDDRRDRVVLKEQKRLSFVSGRQYGKPAVEWFDDRYELYKIRLSTLDTRLPFGKFSLEALSNTFLGFGKAETISREEKARMSEVFRQRTADAYEYAAIDVVNTLLVAEQMRIRDREMYRSFGIPESLIPSMRGTLGGRVSTFLMRAAEAHVATNSQQLRSRKKLNELAARGGVALFDREPTASRFGRQTGDTHGGLLFNRSSTKLAHIAPDMLRDVDMQGCYNRVTSGIDVYLGRPVILEPGDAATTLTEAVAFVSRLAPSDGWLMRVSGGLGDGMHNVLVPSTEGALTTANFKSAKRSKDRRGKVQRVFRQESLRDSAISESRGSKLYTGVVESGVITQATWEVIQTLPPSMRQQYEALRVDSLVFYPKRLIAQNGSEYDQLFAEVLREGAGWRQELDLDQSELVTHEQIGEQYVSLRFPLQDYARRFGELRKQAKDEFGKGSGAELAWKQTANTAFGVLASSHLPTNNFMAANQVTAQARAEAYLMMMALNGIQVITDGCTYRVDQIPAIPFAECLQLQPDYPIKRAEDGGPIPFLPAEQIPADDTAFTEWYRSHVRWFFGAADGGLDRLLNTHDLEQKRTQGEIAFDILLCDGAGNYVKAVNGQDGKPAVTDTSLRGYSPEAKETLIDWMMETYTSGILNSLPPVVTDRELLSLAKATQKARSALQDGAEKVRLPLGFDSGKVLTFRVVKASAFLFRNPQQRIAVLKQLQDFEDRTAAGLELLSLRRSYRSRPSGDLGALLNELFTFIQNGGTNLSREFHLSRLGRAVQLAIADRPAQVQAAKEQATRLLHEALIIRPTDPDQATGLIVSRADLEVRPLL